MKKFNLRHETKLIVLLYLLLSLPIFSSNLFGENQVLPFKYLKWIEEDVAYIITANEKEVFLQLENDRERDLFIEAFWRNRDSNQLDDRNEFREEHFRRIEYANRHFGRISSLKGWKTDRGRIYITLGPPISVQMFDNLSAIYPTVIWSYSGMSKYRLPDTFNIVFYKKRGTGIYRLYSPNMDGPASLVAHTSSGAMDARTAYQELLDEEPFLAKASLSLLPGEFASVDFPSLSSVRLLYDVNDAPHKFINDEYSQKFLLYKDIVETEYSINYIGNDSTSHVIGDEYGTNFVHYLVTLDNFSVNQYDDKYMTRLLLNGILTDSAGNNVFQFERSLPIEFDQAQFERIKAQKFSFQDVFPLIEGEYRFNLLVKNEASKEFTSFEKVVVIPENKELEISNLILSYKADKETPSGKKKPYFVSNLQLYPSLRNEFSSQDNLFLCLQINGLNKELRKTATLHITINEDDVTIWNKMKELKEYDSSEILIEEISLKEFKPAYYKLVVSVKDGQGNQILTKDSLFTVSAVASIPRPWSKMIIHAPSDNPVYSLILGEQYLRIQKLLKAKEHLYRAFQKKSNDPSYGLAYSRALFALKEFEEVIRILSRFQVVENAEALELVGRSHHSLRRYDQAIEYYKEYLSRFGTTFFILSLLGDCYYQTGNNKEALKYWQQSLELNPDQKDLKKLLDSIKKEI